LSLPPTAAGVGTPDAVPDRKSVKPPRVSASAPR
jgi:hypothetical protein